MMRKQRQDQDGPVPLIEGAEVARRLAKQWVHEAELIPLSVLSLDHPEPVSGWETMLEARGIESILRYVAPELGWRDRRER